MTATQALQAKAARPPIPLIAQGASAPPWHSPLLQAVRTCPHPPATARTWRTWLTRQQDALAWSPQELHASAALAWLGEKGPTDHAVSSEQLLAWLQERLPRTLDLVLAEGSDANTAAAGPSNAANHPWGWPAPSNVASPHADIAQLRAQGRAWRDLLLLHAHSGDSALEKMDREQLLRWLEHAGAQESDRATLAALPGIEQLRQAVWERAALLLHPSSQHQRAAASLGMYQSARWPVAQVLAHARLIDAHTLDGARILLVDAIGSDWASAWAVQRTQAHQTPTTAHALAATSGAPQVPEHPLITSPAGWLTLTLKRLLTLACAQDYDGLAFVSGDDAVAIETSLPVASQLLLQDNVSTSLSIPARLIGEDGPGRLLALDALGRVVLETRVQSPKDIEIEIGTGTARQLLEQTPTQARFLGRNCRQRELQTSGVVLGGQRLRTLMDHLLPAVLRLQLTRVGIPHSEVQPCALAPPVPLQAPATPDLRLTLRLSAQHKRAVLAHPWAIYDPATTSTRAPADGQAAGD